MANPLTEAWVGSEVQRVRQKFVSDKEQTARKIRKAQKSQRERQGVSARAVADLYGFDPYGNYLQLEYDLMSRYIDYEEMEEYPELSCLAGETPIYTLEQGWVQIRDLVGTEFHVLAYDKESRSLVPTKASRAWMSGESGHGKPMVRVYLDNGQVITCTADHMFLSKDEKWVEAQDLLPQQRLMPGAVRLRSLNNDPGCYWQVHQPHADSALRSTDGKRWMWMHRLVAETMLGAVPGDGDVVHHVDHNKVNNSPSNLVIEDRSSHAKHHIGPIDNSDRFPEWTDERRRAQSQRMLGNTRRRGAKDSMETRRRKSEAGKGRKKSAEWRRKIAESQPNRIHLTREEVESAFMRGGSVSEAAKILGVSWSTARRRIEQFDLLDGAANHRVLRVEVIEDRVPVYDIEVPGYHNFVAAGVVVHNSAYDIYADDATQRDTVKNQVIWATSQHGSVQNELNELLHVRLRVEEDVWPVARTTSKYGNEFAEILLGEGTEGVIGLSYMSPPTVRRMEDEDGDLLGFIQDVRGNFNVSPEVMREAVRLADKSGRPPEIEGVKAFEDWEVVHWRLRSRHIRSIYGHGIAEPARWIWRRLVLLEDSAVIYRLTRAPARYAFYVNTGDLPPSEAFGWVNRVKNNHKKKKFIDPQTGKLDLRYNPLSFFEDFWIPVNGEGTESTRIDVLSGPEYQQMDDVEYFRQKLQAATKIPAAYMGLEGEAVKGSLSQEDVRFARSVLRVQNEVRNGYKKVCRVHMIAKGMDPDRQTFDIGMCTPSAIFELAQMEVWSARTGIARDLGEYVSVSWLLQHIFGFSESESIALMDTRRQEQQDDALKEVETDAKRAEMEAKAEIEAEKMRAAAEAEMGGGGPSFESRAPRRFRRGKRPLWEMNEGDLEQIMTAGSRSAENHAEDVLGRLEESDTAAGRQFRELKEMMNEFRSSLRAQDPRLNGGR